MILQGDKKIGEYSLGNGYGKRADDDLTTLNVMSLSGVDEGDLSDASSFISDS